MGVSAESINPDLSALMAGGEAFLKRMQELRDAKAAAEAAAQVLGFGQNAKAANDKAQLLLVEAQEKRDADMAALAAEVQSAKDSTNRWVAQAREEASALRAEASALNDQAKQMEKAASADRNAARVALIEADKAAAATGAAAAASADKIISDARKTAEKLTADVSKLKKETESALKAAKDAEDKFTAKLEAIQAAALKG